MYADIITGSMRRAISETARRRRLQISHNQRNNISPRPLERPQHRNVLLDVIGGSKEAKETKKKKKMGGKKGREYEPERVKRNSEVGGRDATTSERKMKLGFKNKEAAYESISLLESSKPLNKRAPTIALLLRRARSHPHQTSGM
eukprot:CAMPEP_0185269132 /NCGR_PEP_ID=MMETSP1359-20130426/38938_1 /TAXON_ID=552665 /ORGANISM="Bigelowiella longifila, Strain CCMP242" /LENGTH=144 /DNA_ID=CAMNT_0027860161 /DNA_START=60 /DNA_END=491 /DNA_ORIENTATION=+